MISYVNMATREEVRQLDAHQGEIWEKGKGKSWTEAARDLVKKIYGIPDLGSILH